MASYSYNGGIQSWVCPKNGLYRFTCVGAKSGNSRAGGKTIYYQYVDKGTVLYIGCGGQGGTLTVCGIGEGCSTVGNVNTGYNKAVTTRHNYGGWWGSHTMYSGGGASHVATATGQIGDVAESALLCVAGGAGSSSEGNNSASGSYGRSTGDNTACNGSGYRSPTTASFDTGYGGSGYVKSSSVTFKGQTYTSSISVGGGTTGNGTVVIDLIQQTTPKITVNGSTITTIKVNGTEMNALYVNGEEFV